MLRKGKVRQAVDIRLHRQANDHDYDGLGAWLVHAPAVGAREHALAFDLLGFRIAENYQKGGKQPSQAGAYNESPSRILPAPGDDNAKELWPSYSFSRGDLGNGGHRCTVSRGLGITCVLLPHAREEVVFSAGLLLGTA